jgi:hypothetical protein
MNKFQTSRHAYKYLARGQFYIYISKNTTFKTIKSMPTIDNTKEIRGAHNCEMHFLNVGH